MTSTATLTSAHLADVVHAFHVALTRLDDRGIETGTPVVLGFDELDAAEAYVSELVESFERTGRVVSKTRYPDDVVSLGLSTGGYVTILCG